jgi:ATP-dependent Zn protease
LVDAQMDEAIAAYHEAGHAVIAVVLGGQIIEATIERNALDAPERDGLVSVRWRELANKQAQLIRELQIVLAGPVAEAIYRDIEVDLVAHPEWKHDLIAAIQLLRLANINDMKAQALMLQTMRQLKRVMDDESHWQAIAEVADLLQAHETIEGEEVHEIVARWIDV